MERVSRVGPQNLIRKKLIPEREREGVWTATAVTDKLDAPRASPATQLTTATTIQHFYEVDEGGRVMFIGFSREVCGLALRVVK